MGLYLLTAPLTKQAMGKAFLCPARPAKQRKDRPVGLEKKRTPPNVWMMSCYVGNF